MHGFGIRMDRYQIIDTCWLDRRERLQLDMRKKRLGLLLILIESATLPHQSAFHIRARYARTYQR
jgi:hypothetical protein